ncbi:MAG: tetratricopeptide repeat protein, partial [Myxococcota bacterium]
MSTPQRRSLSDSSKTPLDALHAEHRQLMMRSRTHPNDPRVWIALGQTRLRMAAPRPATDAFRAALALRPNLPGVQARLATLLIDAGQLEEAERLLKNALSLRPGLPLAQLGLARLHLRRHDSAQAESVLAPLLLLKPSMPEAVAMAADILRRKKTPGKALPMLYRALRETPDRSARSLLFHRIAEAHDALDERAEAMAMWRAANSFRGQDFKPAQHAHAVDILKSRYWPGRVLERARNADPLPVFIVGMPRSGTSLLEQMLDSHPQIKGIGERDEIRVLALSIPQRLDYEQPYYRRLRRINTNVLTELAEGHLAHLRTFIDEPGITRVVDKMPH